MRTEHNEFFRLLREYLTIYLPKQKDASDHTLKSYRETLNLFVTFLAECKKSRLYSITFDDVTQDSVGAFLEWLSDTRNCGIYCEPALFRHTGIPEILRFPQPHGE